MKNTIITEKGFFAIIERYGKDFKIEKFDPFEDNQDILYVEFSSDSFYLRDEQEIDKLFKELEP